MKTSRANKCRRDEGARFPLAPPRRRAAAPPRHREDVASPHDRQLRAAMLTWRKMQPRTHRKCSPSYSMPRRPGTRIGRAPPMPPTLEHRRYGLKEEASVNGGASIRVSKREHIVGMWSIIEIIVK